MAQGCITFCKISADTDDVFTVENQYKNSFIQVNKQSEVFDCLKYLSSDTKHTDEMEIVKKQKQLLQERFGPKNIYSIHDKFYKKLLAREESKSLSTRLKEQEDLLDLNLLFDLVAGPSHHRIPRYESKESRKAKVKKDGNFLIFTNPKGRLIHKGLVPFVLGFDKIKNKKCFVAPKFFNDYTQDSFDQFCIDIEAKKLYLGAQNAQSSIEDKTTSQSSVASLRDATQLLLKRELEEVFLSHIADSYYTTKQIMLPEAEHYSDNALKDTQDRIGFDFDIKIIGEGSDQKIELKIKNINSQKCQDLLQTDNIEEIKNKCFNFLKTTLCSEIKEELIQDKTIDSKSIDEDKLEKKVGENKILIHSSVKEITKKLWYERVPYAALVNIGPNGTILLLEHSTRQLELGGGRGGTPYHPKFTAMAETQGEICVTMKKGSADLIPLSGFYKPLSKEKETRMNGDCFYAPWGTWNAKNQKIQDLGESNTEFTNNHIFTKCWSFADLRTQVKEKKLIRNVLMEFNAIYQKKKKKYMTIY